MLSRFKTLLSLAVTRVFKVARVKPVPTFLAAVMIASTLAYTAGVLLTEASYRLSDQTLQLIGTENTALAKRLKLDKSLGAYRFNPESVTPQSSGETDPAKVAALLASQKQQTGGGSADGKNLYSLDLPIDPKQGTKVYDTNSQTSFKITPQFSLDNGRGEDGRVVYPLSGGGQAIYSVKGNGLKEDVVLSKPRGDQLDLSYKLDLPKSLTAKLDDRGNLGIYGVDPSIISAVTSAIKSGSMDAGRLQDIQNNGDKNHLIYLIPSPVIKQSARSPSASAHAVYTLDKNILTVHASGLQKLTYPVTIDPSVVVTSTADFATGNNEGNISFDTDAISRASSIGGPLGSWTASSMYTGARLGAASVAYNGYLYVLGGFTGTTPYADVQYAPLNTTTGSVGTWTPTTSFTTARSGLTAAAYDGYLYIIGGYKGGGVVLNDVQYAKVASDGTVGPWAATSSFTTARQEQSSVAYNGYIYILGGGISSTSFLSDVQYAPLNADGTVGTWATTIALPTARNGQGTVAYNKYLYVFGGLGGTGATYYSDVYYAPINADGTIGTWTATSSFTTGRWGMGATFYDGYIHIYGGVTNGAVVADIQYAPVNADGTIGTWTTAATALPGPRDQANVVAVNGYAYTLGGATTVGSTGIVDVEYTQFAAPTTGLNESSWTTTTALLSSGSGKSAFQARSNQTSVAFGGYIYEMGGTNGTATTRVDYAPLNAATGAVGTWTATTALPQATAFASSVVDSNGYIYVIGGTNGSTTYYSTVYYAQINSSTGAVGAWSTSTPLSSARASMGITVYNGYIYLAQGQLSSALATNAVSYATLSPSGGVGAWIDAIGPDPSGGPSAPQYGLSAVAYSGYLYLIGGRWGPTNDTSAILFAPLASDGSIGAWVTGTHMLIFRSYSTAAVVNGYIVAVGGENNGTTQTATTEYGKINTDGTISSWTYGTSFTTARSSHAMAYYNGYLYLSGGNNGSTTYYSDVQYASVKLSGGTQGLSTWSDISSPAIPNPVYEAGAAYYNNYLYLLGGNNGGLNGTGQTYVQYVNVAQNGSLNGSWITSSNPLPAVRYNLAAVAYNGYLYAIGGELSASNPQSSVYYAPINSDGSIGSWKTTIAMSTALQDLTSATYNGYLYVLGGQTTGGTYVNTVSYSHINTDGTVSSWTTAAPFSTAREDAQAVTYNGYIYIAGGSTAFPVYLNDVQYAPLNTDGSIGTWITASPMISSRATYGLAAQDGVLYAAAGYSNGSYLSTAEYTDIQADGSLASWSSTAATPSARTSNATVAANGHVYILGGSVSGYVAQSDTLIAGIKAKPAIASYTRPVDLGSAQTIRSIQAGGILPGGYNPISFKTAGTDGIFGTWKNASDSTAFPLTNVRYILIRATLDDSAGAVPTTAVSGRSSVTDITVTYGAIAVTPATRLRGGEFFDDTGVLQPLETP